MGDRGEKDKHKDQKHKAQKDATKDKIRKDKQDTSNTTPAVPGKIRH